MPPTRIGTPMASEAATIPALTSASVKGSTAVEFSGHTTRSGRGTVPASTSAASCSVRATWLAVISRCTAGTSVPSPGTSPWTAATVKSSPRLLTPGTASYEPASGSRVTAARPPTASSGGHRASQAAGDQPGQGRAGERDQQADARSCRATGRPAARRCRRWRRSGVPTAAHRRARRPARSRRATHAKAAHTGQARSRVTSASDHAQGREVEGLEERQREPRRRCRPRASTTAGWP